MHTIIGLCLAAVLGTAAFFMLRNRGPRRENRGNRPPELRLGDIWRFNGRVAGVRQGERPGLYDVTVELPISSIRTNYAGAWVETPEFEITQACTAQPHLGQICRVEGEIVALSREREQGVTLRFTEDHAFSTSRRQVLKYGRKALMQPARAATGRSPA